MCTVNPPNPGQPRSAVVESRRLLRLGGAALLFALGAVAFVALALGGVLAVPATLWRTSPSGRRHGPAAALPAPADPAGRGILVFEHVSSFDWLYGSAAAVLGFLIWTWVFGIAVLIGAARDAELGRQATLSLALLLPR